MDRYGSRTKPEFIIVWAGTPTNFSIAYPYVIAFEHDFVEVVDLVTGVRQQVIHGSNISRLSSDVLDLVMDAQSGGYQHIYRLLPVGA